MLLSSRGNSVLNLSRGVVGDPWSVVGSSPNEICIQLRVGI